MGLDMTREEFVTWFWAAFWKNAQIEFQYITPISLLYMALISFVVIHIVFFIKAKRETKPISLYREVLWIVLLFYFLLILQLCIFGREVSSAPRVFQTKLLQFDTNMGQNMTNFLNMFIFIPYGALISATLSKATRVKRYLMTLVYAFLTSISIETIQYITNRGYFEIDDIEVNLIGALIGAVIMGICITVDHQITMRKQTKED